MLIGAASPIPLGLEAPATKLFRKGLNMNWEFLLGLLLPAYGVGYVWLVKIARNDPALYSLLEKPLRIALIAVFVLSLVASIWARENEAIADAASRNILFFGGLLVFLSSGILISLGMFRRITKLPPKESTKN